MIPDLEQFCVWVERLDEEVLDRIVPKLGEPLHVGPRSQLQSVPDLFHATRAFMKKVKLYSTQNMKELVQGQVSKDWVEPHFRDKFVTSAERV